MRRMYSEQELTKVIKEVFDAELASGALDEQVSNAVDAYLVEHPVDITALEGQDVELNSLDATGLITGGEIVEKMSGYSYERIGSGLTNWTPIYISACKNGNKLTFVIFGTYNSSDAPAAQNLLNFIIPSSIGEKLYPYTLGPDNDVLDTKVIHFFSGLNSYKSAVIEIEKASNTKLPVVIRPIDLVASTTYYFRVEVTFLLSDNFVA